MTRIITVGLGDRAYAIHVGNGLTAQAGALLKPFAPKGQNRGTIPVVTDAIVGEIHLARFLEVMGEAGLDTRPIVMSPGEGSKSFGGLESLTSQLLNMEISRGGLIVALGGGVIGDLTGFAAGILKRGVAFAQVPTTLLSQVDSSVGGKTGINTSHGKNLLGAFHQPRMVLADTATLATLPPRELRAGYAEVAKAGLIGDAAFFGWCEANGAAVIAGDREAQAEAVLRACAFKAQVVGDDEREEKPSDGRALLNLGHTFGHALEAELGYGTILHGEAVALGMGLAFRLSAALGLCPPTDADRVIAHLAAVGLPAELAQLNRRLSAGRLIAHMRRDKKMRDGNLMFVLTRGIGQAFTRGDVAAEAVEGVLREAGCAA